jgi:PAS domain S-box-containing protein
MTFEPDSANEDACFRAIFACAPECIKRITADGRLIDMNPAGLRMIDAASPEEVRGRNVLDLIDPAYHGAFRAALAQVFTGKSVQLQFEVVGLSGRRLWMDQSAAPLFDTGEPSKVVEMVAVTRDITTQRATAADLLRAKISEEVARSRSFFLATVGNELKTPLSEMIGYSELLKETAEEQGRGDAVADLDRVLDAGARLLSMINQMLAVSLEDARQSRSAESLCDLAELIDDALAMTSAILRASEARIQVDLTAAPDSLFVDAGRLGECMRSVLSAAAPFAGRGQIAIKARAMIDAGCSWLQLEIGAEGERLGSCELQERLAASARQSGATAGPDVGASALRLARNTARLMGGEFKIAALPNGARFVLRIPALTGAEVANVA